MADFLFGYFVETNKRHYMATGPSNHSINEVVLQLGFKVEGKPLEKRTGDTAIILLDNDPFKQNKLQFYCEKLGNFLC
jgi:hypothetical protein